MEDLNCIFQREYDKITKLVISEWKNHLNEKIIKI